MKIKTIGVPLLAVTLLGSCLLAPVAANAQIGRRQEAENRQKTKNQWRNIAIGAGALGVLGALKHDNTLTFAGAAGALYSLNRYEQDRKSQSQTERTRAEYFSRPYFERDGHRYTRKTVTKDGKRYYQFVRD